MLFRSDVLVEWGCRKALPQTLSRHALASGSKVDRHSEPDASAYRLIRLEALGSNFLGSNRLGRSIAVQCSQSAGGSEHELDSFEFIEPFLNDVVEQRSFR